MKHDGNFKLAFDPNKADDPEIVMIFKNDYAKKIWCYLKKQHLTNGDFNKRVMKIAKEIKDKRDGNYNYWTFDKFINLLTGEFHGYGIVSSRPYIVDNEYWFSLWQMLFDAGYFEIEINK